MPNREIDEYGSNIPIIALLGPFGIGKKHWMLFIAEQYPAIFHIIRTLTTRPPASQEDRIFFNFMTEEEFTFWQEVAEDEGESFFWTTYERHEHKIGGASFSYGFSTQDLLEIPERICGLIALSSLGELVSLKEECEIMGWLDLKIVRLVPNDIPDGTDFFSQNLRTLGITDKHEVERQGRRAEHFESQTHDVAHVTVRLTGKQEADAIRILDAVRAFNVLPPRE